MKKAFSKLLLLDTSVLLALAWPNHQFHARAVRRVSRKGALWATCAITQLGFIRLSSNVKVNPTRCSPLAAAELLQEMTLDPAHVFLECRPAPATPGFQNEVAGITGYKQVTDVYLRFLALEAGAVFLTFDGRFVRSLHHPDGVELIAD